MFEIRSLAREEVDTAVEWAAREGWNPGHSDAAVFRAVDVEGFLGGFVDGHLVATVSAVRYSDAFGFVGFYIVEPSRRGQGYGIQVWDAALSHLSGVRTVGLDGVVDQQENYRRSGFELAHRNARYEGVCGATAASAAPGSVTLVDAATVPFAALSRWDAAHFGADRAGFVRDWIGDAGHTARVALTAGGDIAGFAVSRPCRTGVKVGPLFAEDARVADALVDAVLAGVRAGTPYFIDPPTANVDAIALVERRGMHAVFETARMYRGTPLVLPLTRVFGISSFELG